MKTLLTSGCSFTEDRPGGFYWPNLISKQMNTKLVNVGSGMSGNSFISKQLINTIYHHYMNEKELYSYHHTTGVLSMLLRQLILFPQQLKTYKNFYQFYY